MVDCLHAFHVHDRETFVNTFMLQIGVLSNHLNGRDTHVRQIKVYGPRPYVLSNSLIPSLSSLVVGNCLTEELSVTEIRFRINHFSSPLESLLCIQL